MKSIFTDFVCAECATSNISVECVVIQDADGELVIKSVCDSGHTCNDCGSEHIAKRLKTTDALKEIQQILDQTEWDSSTADNIAMIVRRAGYPVREPMLEDPEPVTENVDMTQCPINDWCTLPEAHVGECMTVADLRNSGPRYGAKEAS